MKKYITLLLIGAFSLILTTSCLKAYLDKAPEQGLTDAIVFTKLTNFKLFFDAVYFGQTYYNNGWRNTDNILWTTTNWGFDSWDQKYIWEVTTDAADQGRYMEGQAWKSGNMSETIVNKLTYDYQRRPILIVQFKDIRIANMAMDNVDRIEDATEAEKNDLRAQAYFIRAWCHFTLFKIWGPMPYLDHVIGPEDQWDIPRLTAYETLKKIAADCDTAYNFFNLAGKVRRDDDHNQNYSSWQMYRPNGMAAKALKSRVLLYAASPLNTTAATVSADWVAAANASWDALQTALSNGISLMPNLVERKLNYVGTQVCDETIWSWFANNGTCSWNNGFFQAVLCGSFGASTGSWSGTSPTQNWVDKYETLDGDPLNTQDDRDAATTAGHYYEQDPYSNRDPRLDDDVIRNQGECIGYQSGKAQIWFDGATPGQLIDTKYLGRTQTGYLIRKLWAGNSQFNKTTNIIADPIFRLTELYLNYAEAANEAYGPKTAAPGATLTAEGAINLIRARAGMPNVLAQFVTDKDAFRPRIWNERNVELSWEGHYYNDIRRWKILQDVMASTLYGMIPQVVPVDATYPTGFMYARYPLSPDRQPIWKPQMYYLPFNNADALKMKNFVANPVW